MRRSSIKRHAQVTATLLLAAAIASCSPPPPTQAPETSTPSPFVPGDPTATPPGEDISDPDYLAGKNAYWAGDYEAVLPLMQSVLDQDPALAPPHWYRGMAYWQMDDCESGLPEMEAALEIDPTYALAWADRGLMRECLGQESEALSDYRKALSLDPSLAKVHERLGAASFDAGEYQDALDEYDRAIEIDAGRATAWVGRGQALQFLLRFEECIESATQATRVDPEYWPAFNLRGSCAFGMGDYQQGIPDLERYLAEEPGDVDAWYNLGVGYRRTGQLDQAVDTYTRVLTIDSTYVQAWINRGSIFIDQGLFDGALSDYDKALGVAEIPAAYNGRAAAYMGLGRFEEALADLERSIELMPFSTAAYCQVVNVYFTLGKYRDTIWAAQEAARLSPECAKDQRLLELQARSYYALGLYDQAVEYMDRALEQGTYVLAFYYRGIAQDDAGHWHEATMDLETFVQVATIQDIGGAELADAEARLARLRKETPAPGATPDDLAQATPIALEGIGPFGIEPGEAVTFNVVPTSAVTIQLVGNAALYFVGLTAEGGEAADVVFMVWDHDYAEWSDGQGNYRLTDGSSVFGLINPSTIVGLHGDFLIRILNRGPTSVTVAQFQATMSVLTTDGRTLELGAMPIEP